VRIEHRENGQGDWSAPTWQCTLGAAAERIRPHGQRAPQATGVQTALQHARACPSPCTSSQTKAMFEKLTGPFAGSLKIL
jgi:hypothetical protein